MMTRPGDCRFSRSAPFLVKIGAPGRIRTCGLRIRSPLLCPAELRAHPLFPNTLDRFLFFVTFRYLGCRLFVACSPWQAFDSPLNFLSFMRLPDASHGVRTHVDRVAHGRKDVRVPRSFCTVRTPRPSGAEAQPRRRGNGQRTCGLGNSPVCDRDQHVEGPARLRSDAQHRYNTASWPRACARSRALGLTEGRNGTSHTCARSGCPGSLAYSLDSQTRSSVPTADLPTGTSPTQCCSPTRGRTTARSGSRSDRRHRHPRPARSPARSRRSACRSASCRP